MTALANSLDQHGLQIPTLQGKVLNDVPDEQFANAVQQYPHVVSISQLLIVASIEWGVQATYIHALLLKL